MKALLTLTLLGSLLVPTTPNVTQEAHETLLKAAQIKEITDFIKGTQVPFIRGVFYPGQTILFGGKPDKLDWEAVNEQPLERRWGHVWGCEIIAYGDGELIQVCPHGACDSLEECDEEMDQACTDSGNGGVDSETVELTTHDDGSITCSGDCLENGAVAFQTCVAAPQ